MHNLYLHLIDYFFVVFHTLLIFFNLTGWIWKQTRKLHLVTVLLTGGSWLILGLFYGLGYCPLTDWHFTVLVKLGAHDLPLSYIQYLIERLTGADLSAQLIDIATLVGYLLVLALSIYFNFFSSKQDR